MTQLSGNQDNTPELRQLIRELGDKLDAFIQSLPGTYVLRIDLNEWKITIDQRLKTLEDDAKSDRERAGQEQKGIVEEMQQMERRILAKIDEKEQQRTTDLKEVKDGSQAFKILVLLNLIAWIIVPTLFLVVNYFLNHR